MPAEDTTSLAPPQGAVWGTDVATMDDLPALVHPYVKFTLMWPGGAVIGKFFGDSIDGFVEELEDGLIQGVVPIHELIMTNREDVDLISFASYYYLLWGTIELNESRTFLEYCMPEGAGLTLNVRWEPWKRSTNISIAMESNATTANVIQCPSLATGSLAHSTPLSAVE